MSDPRRWTSGEACLEDKVVWLTGATGGLGRVLAGGAARAGAQVVLTSRTDSEIHRLTDVLEPEGLSALGLAASVTDVAVVGALVEQILATEGRLDVLINCAGVSPAYIRSESLDDALWRNVIDTNLSGAFYCAQAAGRVMLQAGAGSIVNVSSVHGHVAGPRLAAYAASKGALEALTRTLAVEWADRGVRVNAVAPGYFAAGVAEPLLTTRWREPILARVPMGRFAHADELVGAVMFLAGESSSYVTGTTIFVDGGWTAQ
jgi:NAD(P)-dependent dehydrogenase (short-subunit alcohol dehydrogenase family)